MSVTLDQPLLAQTIFVIGGCVGAFMLFVEPRMDELARLESAIAESQTRVAAMDHVEVVQLADRVPEAYQRLGRITERSRMALDSASLFERIMKLAQTHEIEVKALQPRVHDTGSDEDDTQVTRIELTTEGEYHRVAEFLDSLETVDAYLRAQSLHVMPAKVESGRPTTMMQLGCEALWFRVPDELAHLVAAEEP